MKFYSYYKNFFEYVDSDLTEETKRKAIVYIMDRYQVSLKAYHELSQIACDLPRTYLLENEQKKMSNAYEIFDTPGEEMSAQTSLIEELQKDPSVAKSGIEKVLVRINLIT